MATRSLLASRLLRRRCAPSSGSSAARLCCDDESSCRSLPYLNKQLIFVAQSWDAGFHTGTKSTERFVNTAPRFNNRSGHQLKSPLGLSVICRQHVNPVNSMKSMVHRRKFASKSNDDENTYDDVEARLIGDDGNSREGMYMATDSSYGMAGADFNDYGGESMFGEESWAKYGKGTGASIEDEGEEGDEELGGIYDSSGEETGSAYEASDDEFEGERTDEELDELLENTPLFEPPEYDGPEENEPAFSFRPEGPVYYPGMEYEPEELDVTRPLPRRRREPRPKEVITVQEVIDKADFRNVRYLTKFITETGNIIARKQFDMRNKSHGRITKAIKTARFFGLMPYSNMGRPKFVFNEPFDEFSEFYDTDEDESEGQDSQEGANYGGRGGSTGYGQFPERRGGFNDQGTRRSYF